MLSPTDNHVVPQKPIFKRVSEWLKDFQDNKGWLSDHLREIYGNNQPLIDNRKNVITKALDYFGSIYGTDREVVITRSPCRINLRGMHSEMQHATPNYLTHARETIIIAGKRDDDLVVLNNVENEKFGRRQFSISEEMNRGRWGNWIEYIDSNGVRKSIEANRGDWANYIKASILKIQDNFADKELKGMDIVAYGDVPRGNGMSSSSTLVVSSGLSFLAVNDLAMDRRELVVCFGRGEWYVGTRGGFGDHGSMLFGKRGHILHSVFLAVEEMNPEYIPFPQDHQVVIINSYKTSSKSAERLFAYNQTMFGYSMAMTLIKDVLKDVGRYSDDLLNQIYYLGQIKPEVFGLDRIYEILRNLPQHISISDLKARYTESEIEKRLDRFFGQLKRFPESVDVRGPALWGIAESERSRKFAELIKNGRLKDAGELMYIGHDGDRLISFDGDGKHNEFVSNKVTDDYLDRLLADLNSNDPEQIKKAELAKQPGDYDASSHELDMIVDIASHVDGIIGASLTGAGFGGNILAITEKDDRVLNNLKDALSKEYYEPKKLEELRWFDSDHELQSAYGNDDELSEIRQKVRNIVQKKAKIEKDDLLFMESLQQRVNKLFKEGKISRELMFIPANYYDDGIVVNVTVDNAESL
jgi:N-acetylgalactosamine kinase